MFRELPSRTLNSVPIVGATHLSPLEFAGIVAQFDERPRFRMIH